MSKYLKYLKYILEHKKNVFIECWKVKEYRHAFTHDLSKFRPSEFIPYARHFYGSYISNAVVNNVPILPRRCKQVTKEEIKVEFEKAWELHYKRNKHHPEYWNSKDMDNKSIIHMVCDLKAMSRKFGGTAQHYYLKNYHKWDISRETRYRLEIKLDLIHRYNASICECNNEYYMTIEELIKDMEEFYDINGTISMGSVKDCLNDLLKPACDDYNLDIYELVKN